MSVLNIPSVTLPSLHCVKQSRTSRDGEWDLQALRNCSVFSLPTPTTPVSVHKYMYMYTIVTYYYTEYWGLEYVSYALQSISGHAWGFTPLKKSLSPLTPLCSTLSLPSGLWISPSLETFPVTIGCGLYR